MNTLLKLTLILFSIFGFAISALIFFAQSRVSTPPSMPVADKVFSDYVGKEIDNFPGNSGVRLWSRWFDKVLYLVDRSAEEGFISAEERKGNVQRSFRIYVPKFVKYSLDELDKKDWEWQPVPPIDGTMLTDFLKYELDKLANNKYDVEMSYYKDFCVVSSTIRDYFEAKSLVHKSSYRSEERTVTILNRQRELCKNERLQKNSELMRNLKSLPGKIRRSHMDMILANQINSFHPGYEHYLEKVSEFHNLWRDMSSYSETNELLSPACAFLNANIDAINRQFWCKKNLYYTIWDCVQNYPGSKSDLHKLNPSDQHRFF